jgi:cell division ATPase FtsA
VEIKTNEIVKAISKDLREMIKAIKDVLQETPPELSSDIIDKGIIMTGGTSQLRNFTELVFRRTGISSVTVLVHLLKHLGNLHLHQDTVSSQSHQVLVVLQRLRLGTIQDLTELPVQQSFSVVQVLVLLLLPTSPRSCLYLSL